MSVEEPMAAAPVRAELAGAGCAVEHSGELSALADYRAAIPILLRWRPRVEDRHVTWAIVGALGVRWARPRAAPALIAKCRRVPADEHYGYKGALASMLAEVVDDSVFAELVSLVCDPGPGRARQRLVAAFDTRRDPRAVAGLIALLGDAAEEIVEQALLALGRLKAARARWYSTGFLTQDDPPLWRAAQRALARIDRARERKDQQPNGMAAAFG
jgi:hypothetical protein